MVNSARTASPCRAVIDLGSNSVILLVLERGGKTILDESKITRLGEGVFESGYLAPAAIERTRDVVREFSERARQLGATSVVGVGTEALRRARDGRDFLVQLCHEGWLDEARLLEGREEASLAIEASRREQGPGRLAVIDVGGGSTEFAWAPSTDPAQAVQGLSLAVGSVRLTEALLPAHPIPATDMRALGEFVQGRLSELGDQRGAWTEGEVVAVAGTATTLAALELRLEVYDGDAVEGLVLERSILRGWIQRLSQMSVEERRALAGMEAGRADVIVAGLVVLESVLDLIAAPRFRISGRGVRHGVGIRLLEGRGWV